MDTPSFPWEPVNAMLRGAVAATPVNPRAYTIGLVEFGHPEVVVLGLDSVSAKVGLNYVGKGVMAGRPMAVGVQQKLGGLPSKLLDVPFDWLSTDPSRMAMWFDYYHSGPFSRHAPDVLQLVWSD